MSGTPTRRLAWLVFALACAVFTTVYVPQPVLPVLRAEFGVSEGLASYTVSALILGMALANLPFGALADRQPVRPILLAGGVMVAVCGAAAAFAPGLKSLIAVRFAQGLFVPALTTCLAAYLGRAVPPSQLNVVLGSYVSATVVGGLSGRLLSGWAFPAAHWRWAFLASSALLLAATVAGYLGLPKEDAGSLPGRGRPAVRFRHILFRHDLFRIYCVGGGAFFVFSSVFNYLPFYLHGPPFGWTTRGITLVYLSYLAGAVTGPLAGRLCDRVGNGAAMVWGSGCLGIALALTLVPQAWAIALSLTLVCVGFFTVHASAAAALNLKLVAGRGKANAMYVLVYYLGGALGITVAGRAFHRWGWKGVVGVAALALLVPFSTGLVEWRTAKRNS
jgi:YNFM family putative membrane transporter